MCGSVRTLWGCSCLERGILGIWFFSWTLVWLAEGFSLVDSDKKENNHLCQSMYLSDPSSLSCQRMEPQNFHSPLCEANVLVAMIFSRQSSNVIENNPSKQIIQVVFNSRHQGAFIGQSQRHERTLWSPQSAHAWIHSTSVRSYLRSDFS